MSLNIPSRYKPLFFVAIVAAIGLATYIANAVFMEPVADCCATDFDPTPYEQVPARTTP